jgi:hypothetical protein
MADEPARYELRALYARVLREHVAELMAQHASNVVPFPVADTARTQKP